jgi:hypothetical protein
MKVFTAIFAGALLVSGAGLAHEMGRFGGGSTGTMFLYGFNRLTKSDGINCCKYGGTGDCQEYPADKVKIVDGGYLLDDGEFIAQHDTSVSPLDADGEYRYYRCRHPDTLTHCFFVPPSGS